MDVSFIKGQLSIHLFQTAPIMILDKNSELETAFLKNVLVIAIYAKTT